MKWRFLILFLAIAIALAGLAWLAFHNNDPVEWHKQAWHEAVRELVGQTSGRGVHRTIWAEFKRLIRPERTTSQRMREHERALYELGYLTNHDFLLTNQTLTREGRSNFVRTLQVRFGTNGECVWSLGGLTNGYHAMLPAADVAEWERIFRECAERCASNVPITAVTIP